jgi:hypothetical protein
VDKSLESLERFLEIVLPVCWKGQWLTVAEMGQLTGYEASMVRWCVKQLKTGKEGNFIVRRRVRPPDYRGQHEFYIKRKPAQQRLVFVEPGIRV